MKSQSKTPTNKKQHSIYDIQQTGDCSSIKRAKLFGELKKDYLNRMRDLYHQTDHLANYTDLSVFNEPLEHTPKGTFLGKISPYKYASSRKYCTPRKDAKSEVSALEASADIDSSQENNTNEITINTPMKANDNEIVQNSDEVAQQINEVSENQIDKMENEEDQIENEQNIDQEEEDVYQVEEEEEEEILEDITLSQKDQELIDDVVNSVLDDESNSSLIIVEEEEEEFNELVVDTNEDDTGYSLETSN